MKYNISSNFQNQFWFKINASSNSTVFPIEIWQNNKPVMRLNDFSSNNLIGTDATIVGSLWCRVSVLGPAEGSVIEIQKCVLLFNTKPGFLGLHSFHRFIALESLVRRRRSLITIISVAKNQFVVSSTEGVVVNRNRVQEHVAVLSCRLTSGTPIKRPDWQI